jgi:hypothetical protein
VNIVLRSRRRCPKEQEEEKENIKKKKKPTNDSNGKPSRRLGKKQQPNLSGTPNFFY